MGVARNKIVVTPRVNLGLRVIGGISALISLGALVAHVLGLLPMAFFLTFFGVPSLLVLFALAAFGKWINATVFLRCLVVGVLGGLVATLAYDGVRFVFHQSRVLNYNGFIAIYIFGSWITGLPQNTVWAAVAGWVYHFWNGISFGIFYVLTFGRRHWLYGVGYGLVMEACMLGLFPIFLTVTNKFDFIALSMIGHLAYGAVLGRIAQKYAQNWQDTVPLVA